MLEVNVFEDVMGQKIAIIINKRRQARNKIIELPTD